MISALVAAALTFTATATGLEKGAPVEFLFAGEKTDRDYETMFVLDGSLNEFCAALEKAGLPRGKTVDVRDCRLWPIGCRMTFKPDLSEYVVMNMPNGFTATHPIYTGGLRATDGSLVAETAMPMSMFSTYSLAQSPFVYDIPFDQGVIYNSVSAAKTLEKGARVTFTVSWDDSSLPQHLDMTVSRTNAVEIIRRLKEACQGGPVEATVSFDGNLTLGEATRIASALAVVDSPAIRINGCGNVFYRSFLPLVKWRDRKERASQPLELTVGDPDKLVLVEEDWSGEGMEPKLSPREITFAEAAEKFNGDACFVYASATTTISRLIRACEPLKDNPSLKSWYFFELTQP